MYTVGLCAFRPSTELGWITFTRCSMYGVRRSLEIKNVVKCGSREQKAFWVLCVALGDFIFCCPVCLLNSLMVLFVHPSPYECSVHWAVWLKHFLTNDLKAVLRWKASCLWSEAAISASFRGLMAFWRTLIISLKHSAQCRASNKNMLYYMPRRGFSNLCLNGKTTFFF